MNIHLITKSNCSYCEQAKALLTKHNLPFTSQLVGRDIIGSAVQERFPYARTYPIIIIDGKYIGGFTNLASLIQIREIDREGQGHLLITEENNGS